MRIDHRRGGHAGGTFALPGGETGLPIPQPEELSVVEPAGKEVSGLEKKCDLASMRYFQRMEDVEAAKMDRLLFPEQ